MARKSGSNLAHSLFRVGLLVYMYADQSKSTQGVTGYQASRQILLEKDREVEIDIFPDRKAKVEQFRAQLQAATHSKREGWRAKLSPNRKIHERARLDCENARGTIHRQLLLNAEPNLQAVTRKAHKQVIALEGMIGQLESERDTELRKAVVRPIVDKELATLPGIGPRLATAIQSQIFTGTLESLRQASQIEGIGPQKQATINNWIDDLLLRLPDLLNGPFLYKAEITARYTHEIREKKAELNKARAYENDLRKTLQQLYDELDWLMGVTSHNFEMALSGNNEQHECLSRYLLGVFPSWEQMPKWFARALEASGQAKYTDN